MGRRRLRPCVYSLLPFPALVTLRPPVAHDIGLCHETEEGQRPLLCFMEEEKYGYCDGR